jgi:predicted Rossmann fold nucleotide-binding protein DprA/Smf involved in DNA uptake
MSERIAIIGTRGASPARQAVVEQIIKELPQGTIIVTGDEAYGVDSYVVRAGTDMGFVVVKCFAPWVKLGKSAGPIRNNVVASMCTCMIAIWDGKSKGTKNAIDAARRMGKEVEVFEVQ